MKYKLFFDTSDRSRITVKLFDGNSLLLEVSKSQKLTSQALLPEIVEVLNQYKITAQDISEIEINPGPGSYTGLKVGAAVANAFGWYLKIPVNGKKNNIVKPVFE